MASIDWKMIFEEEKLLPNDSSKSFLCFIIKSSICLTRRSQFDERVLHSVGSPALEVEFLLTSVTLCCTGATQSLTVDLFSLNYQIDIVLSSR